VPAPRYLRPEHTIEAHERAIERAIGLGWCGGCEAVTGRLEPAGAQVHTESRQAERSNQTKTAEPHDSLERMIAGPHNRTHRNHRNGRHSQPPCQPEMNRAWEVVGFKCLWAIATHR
jgi:hypothetical protein